MKSSDQAVIALEKKFWQSLVDQDADAALALLCEPALMVSAHGAMKFDHAAYRKMAEQGSMVVKSFEISDIEVVFPNDATAIMIYRVRQEVASRSPGAGAGGQASTQEMVDSSTWVRDGERWLCAMHTETPAAPKTRSTP
jgi:ketosteroid isomerase-like protein